MLAIKCVLFFGDYVNLVDGGIWGAEAASSSLASPTFPCGHLVGGYRLTFRRENSAVSERVMNLSCLDVGVVQLVEHLLAKQDVAGSIPVIHSSKAHQRNKYNA